MPHRHVIGELITTFFVAQRNSDLTEGRGGMVDVATFDNHNDAKKRVERQGVQGCGDGDVVVRSYYRCEECPELIKIEKRIYHGDTWSKNQAGKKGWEEFMPDGWHVDYSPMASDPEYKEYIRLKAKYEK